MEVKPKLANNLKIIRNQRGMSRLELSEKAGITAEAIRLLEDGRRSPTLSTAYSIATILEVEVERIWSKESLARHLDPIFEPEPERV